MSIELAKAYVQIVPSAKGIKGGITRELNGEASTAGKKAGETIASKIKGAIAVAGIGKALQATIMEGGKLQQSIGGIETLFKSSADTVRKYANEAYKTAGLSANSYMEQVTSFSASLLQSLGGNTKKAAESANQAIIDMSDNSNKMGTDMISIQNAYQGFAKQNYTMLDNLKLGYGGTKKEMERLLADASKLTGVKYDISNLNDVYSAIHVIQNELGITGTTALEASTTLTGSMSSVKSALQNLMGNMALGENLKPSLDALLETTSTFLTGNLIPMIGNVVKSIPQIISEIVPLITTKGVDLLVNLSKGFVQGFPKMAKNVLDLVQNIATGIAKQAPLIINKGFEMLSNLVKGITNAFPVLIAKVPTIISTFANIINDNAPTILRKGVDLLLELIKGIISAIPTLVANIPKIIKAIVDVIQAFQWLDLGKKIINLFANGIGSMVGAVGNQGKNVFNAINNALKNLPSTLSNLGKSAMNNLTATIKGLIGSVKTQALKIASTIESALLNVPGKMKSIGKNIVNGIWNGISSMTGYLYNKVASFANNIVKKVKGALQIHSPSRIFETEVGKMIPLGMAKGIEENIRPVNNALDKLSEETIGVLDTSAEVTTRNYTSITNDDNNMLAVIVELLKLIAGKGENNSGNDANSVLNRILMILADYLPQLANMQLVTDTGALVGELAVPLDERLGIIQRRKAR